MWLIDKLAEQAIDKARREGQLDNLPGEGKPQQLEDDSQVPEQLRAGYRLLKNGGFLPPELEARKEYLALHELLETVEAPQKAELQRRLRQLELILGDRFRQLPAAVKQQAAARSRE
ncbi:DnaJ family domain-containing protein [Zobellella maritima]|uniref:DnaJ family domain-containing protein n=1 Tax=Zobellella maritima TaxID=2059725 RepID=UPI000E306168|nr:DnaJ family domain-containing protein [Zobellella maritima]